MRNGRQPDRNGPRSSREGRKQLEAREARSRRAKKKRTKKDQAILPRNRDKQKMGSRLVKYQSDLVNLVTMFYIVREKERERENANVLQLGKFYDSSR